MNRRRPGMRWVVMGLVFALCAAQAGRAQAPPSPVTWTETRFTDAPLDQVDAVVGDGKVAWLSERSPGVWEVRVRDLATGDERAITSGPGQPYAPDVDGDYVVYGALDSADPADTSDVFAFNLIAGVETLLSTDPGAQGDPAVSGDWVVWSDLTSDDIKGRRLSGGPIETFASGAAPLFRPRISGDQVVFEQLTPLPGSWDIFGYDISTTASYPVAVGPSNDRQPDVDGTRVVYLRFLTQDSNGEANVFLFDIASGLTTQLTTTPALRRRPRISGNTVVWYEGPFGDWDVRGFDLVTGTELPLVVDPSSSANLPDVEGHDVVFPDDRNGHWDIYRLTLNRAPEASAGPDQEVEATSPQGAMVTLDGSASSDPDGDPLTFTWTGPFGTLNGAVVSAPVPLGTSEITLTVADAWGGTASDTLTVVVQPTARCPEVYVETFDPHGAHADPAGWVDFKLGDHGPVEADGFRTSRFGRRIVYEARRACRASEYRTPEALAWRDYEWSGWYRPPHDQERGDGFFVYSDLLGDRFYLVGFGPHSHRSLSRRHDGYSLVKSGGGRLEGRVRSGLVPRGGAWYRFRVQVVNEPEATRLRARFWRVGRREPSEWMIDARDSVDPLRSGAIGLLALARGARYENFRVQALSGPASGISGDRDGDGICDGEDCNPDELSTVAGPLQGGVPCPSERQGPVDDEVDEDVDEDGQELSAEASSASSSRCRRGSRLLACPREYLP